jgi:hypothetical protein
MMPHFLYVLVMNGRPPRKRFRQSAAFTKLRPIQASRGRARPPIRSQIWRRLDDAMAALENPHPVYLTLLGFSRPLNSPNDRQSSALPADEPPAPDRQRRNLLQRYWLPRRKRRHRSPRRLTAPSELLFAVLFLFTVDRGAGHVQNPGSESRRATEYSNVVEGADCGAHEQASAGTANRRRTWRSGHGVSGAAARRPRVVKCGSIRPHE